jgi:hypothetical protein
LILYGQIYESGLDRHDPTKARHDLVLGWTNIFTLQTSTTRSKNFLSFSDLNPFDTKHGRLSQVGPAKFSALDGYMRVFDSSFIGRH